MINKAFFINLSVIAGYRDFLKVLHTSREGLIFTVNSVKTLVMQHYRGRVVDHWLEQENFLIEIIAQSDRHVFVLKPSKDFDSLAKGDWVEIECDESFQVVRLKKWASVHPLAQWDPTSDAMRWNRFSSGSSRFFKLHQRQCVLRSLRQDLMDQGFLEVETPLCVPSACPDTYIEPWVSQEGYLVTSTEYQMKRLIVGGFEKIFTLTKNFRANDRGVLHSSEFTMLEWARAYESIWQIEQDAVRLIQKAFSSLYPDSLILNRGESQIQLLDQPWERLTVQEAFEQYLHLKDCNHFSFVELSQAVKKAGLKVPDDFKKDAIGLMSYLLGLVQPFLGKRVPTFLRDWPAFMTSSAAVKPEDTSLVERSELYIDGIEISDGFPFLTDPVLQQVFFDRELEKRKLEGKQLVRIDTAYLHALKQGLPPGAGMALGVDRLVMLLTGAYSLQEVQAFSWEEL